MNLYVKEVVYIVASALFIVGIKRLSGVRTARQGNFLAALGMFLAVVVTLFSKEVLPWPLLVGGLVLGSAFGAVLAVRVQMTGMPQMVAVLNGFGGIASLLVAAQEYVLNLAKGALPPPDTGVTIVLSIIIGGITFTGSMIAFGKLQGLVTEKAVIFRAQHALNGILFMVVFAGGTLMNLPNGSGMLGSGVGFAETMWMVAAISLILGILLVIPIGGADMPVVIALLNSYSGIAAAMTGFVLKNNVLIITGSLVGASGIILTQIMCKSMNRSLVNVLLGGFGATAGTDTGASDGSQITIQEVGVEEAAMLFDSAQSVVIVPGYGMAVAQAQHVVKELCDILKKRGATVKFAIHPVAGRMPGHMNVLLAEANVPYDILFEMDDINDEFSNTDVAVVLGANDVVNPAARSNPASPIYGMPILNVDKARTVIINKRSMRPGYAGIENELFGFPNAVMYFGDAKDAIGKLNSELKSLD